MNKKTITGLIVFSVLIILLSFSIKASIFATIGMKGLSFASPEAAQIVQTVISIQNPAAWAQGYVTQQISGEIMAEIAKQSSEAAQAIQQYNQVKGWIDQGAQITEDLKLNDKGTLAGGSITMSDEMQDVSSLISSDLEEGSIKVANAEVSAKEEGGDVTFTAKEGASIEINGKKYENLKEGSTIIIGRDRAVKEADITTTKAGTYEFGGREIQAEKDTRIVYKDGKIEAHGEGKTIHVDKQKITIGGESVTIDGQKITGKDFTLDEKRFTGLEGKDAEVTIVEEGYLLGKNTAIDSDRMIIESKEGNVLYSKMCQDVSGFSNYINPCRRTLNMEGKGFLVQLKEGKHFGLDVEKGDVLKYEFNGGKVVIDNGAQNIVTGERGEVTVTNGEFKITYTKIDGVPHTMMDPNSIGKNPDVAMSTTCGDISSIENPDGAQTVYRCPPSGTGAAVTGASFFQKCTATLGVNTEKTNKFIGTELFEKQKITTVGQAVPYQRPDGTTEYTVSIETTDVAGNTYKYSLRSDGTITKWNPEKSEWEETDYMITSEADLKEFGVIREEPVKPEPELSPIEKMGQKAESMWNKGHDESVRTGELANKNQFFIGPNRKGWLYLQTSKKGPTILNTDYAVRPIKDATGKVTSYESYDSLMMFKPIGDGKVEIIK